MSKRRFGAPAEYARGGQSQSAREAARPAQFRMRAGRRALFENPEVAAEHFPRITWEDALARAGENARWLRNIDAISAAMFRHALPKSVWHQAALALYDMRAPFLSVREAVECAWDMDGSLFMALAGEELFPILRYCRFRLPPGLPEDVPVWRGTRGVDLERARSGLCWSLSRKVACTWAIHTGTRTVGRIDGAPLVVRRTIRRDQILLYINGHDMEEVVFDAPAAGEVDGEFNEWLATAKTFAFALAAREAFANCD